MSSIVQGHKGLLLQSFSDILDGVASPNLSLLYNPARRHHTVGRNDASLLENGSLHNHRVVANVDVLFDKAGVESAVVLDYRVSMHDQPGSEASGRGGCGMEHAVVANTDIFGQTEW